MAAVVPVILPAFPTILLACSSALVAAATCSAVLIAPATLAEALPILESPTNLDAALAAKKVAPLPIPIPGINKEIVDPIEPALVAQDIALKGSKF